LKINPERAEALLLRGRAESREGNKSKGEADMAAANAIIEKLRPTARVAVP
jgi:hypothetical protein